MNGSAADEIPTWDMLQKMDMVAGEIPIVDAKERDKLLGYPATATVMVMASSWACDKRLKEKVSGTMVI
jgi:hypothetical protein